MKDLSHYSLLAELFRYPSERLKDNSAGWRNLIMVYGCELIRDIDLYIRHLEETSLEYQQEYFVSTFDVQPLCCLDIGYVLFGEDNRRGQFMANLKVEHRKAGNNCGTELSDNLPVLLTLLPKLSDSEFAEELVVSIMVPAIHEMISRFRSTENHYKALLKIVAAIMEKDYPHSTYKRFELRYGKRRDEKAPSENIVPK